MHKPLLAVTTVCLVFSSPSAWSQALNACDLNADGKVDLLDVQLATNMAIGTAACTANVAGSGVCNVVVVQRVVNAALTGTCMAGTLHTVTLKWTASTASNVVGYNVYRGTASGGPYTKITSTPVACSNYYDTAVQSGQTYYYVATAVDSTGTESAYSTQVQAAVPSPVGIDKSIFTSPRHPRPRRRRTFGLPPF